MNTALTPNGHKQISIKHRGDEKTVSLSLIGQYKQFSFAFSGCFEAPSIPYTETVKIIFSLFMLAMKTSELFGVKTMVG